MNRQSFPRTLAAVVAAVVLAASPAWAQAPGAASSLPPAVQKAFAQAYPAATIRAVSPAQDGGRPVHRIESVEKGRTRTVLYAANGTLVQVAEQVTERDLPAPVAAAMHSHPRAIFVSGLKVTRNGAVHYELTLRGTRKTAMVAKPDGTVVSFK